MPILDLSRLLDCCAVAATDDARLFAAIGNLLLLRPSAPSGAQRSAAALITSFVAPFRAGRADLYFDHYGICIGHLMWPSLPADNAASPAVISDGFILPGRAVGLQRHLRAQGGQVAAGYIRLKGPRRLTRPLAPLPRRAAGSSELHPHFVAGCASSLRYAILLGRAGYLLAGSAAHAAWNVDQALALLQTPLLLQQYAFEPRADGTGEDLVLWANVTPPTMASILSRPTPMLHPSEWSNGRESLVVARFASR